MTCDIILYVCLEEGLTDQARLIICLIFYFWRCLKFDFKVGGASWWARKRESWSPPWRHCRGIRDSRPFPPPRPPHVFFIILQYAYQKIQISLKPKQVQIFRNFFHQNKYFSVSEHSASFSLFYFFCSPPLPLSSPETARSGEEGGGGRGGDVPSCPRLITPWGAISSLL